VVAALWREFGLHNATFFSLYQDSFGLASGGQAAVLVLWDVARSAFAAASWERCCLGETGSSSVGGVC
jgi:hypothetical protein